MPPTNPYRAPQFDEGAPTPEFDSEFEKCIRCGASTEAGFAHGGSGFLSCESMFKFFQLPESLSKRTMWSRVTSQKVRYYRSYLCRSCGCYVVDSGLELLAPVAKDMARLRLASFESAKEVL